jgi:hypothetical protein
MQKNIEHALRYCHPGLVKSALAGHRIDYLQMLGNLLLLEVDITADQR